ncbi:MAG: transcription antitermination factor NusB [Eubacterium sp.]
MNRIQQREQAFFLVFQNQFSALADVDGVSNYSENVEEVGEYAKELYQGVCSHKEELDDIVSSFSNGWKLNRIPKVNLSILRLAVYEMKYVENVPDSVAINEAVELAKKYSGKEDASFINGILGAYSRSREQ